MATEFENKELRSEHSATRHQDQEAAAGTSSWTLELRVLPFDANTTASQNNKAGKRTPIPPPLYLPERNLPEEADLCCDFAFWDLHACNKWDLTRIQILSSSGKRVCIAFYGQQFT